MFGKHAILNKYTRVYTNALRSINGPLSLSSTFPGRQKRISGTLDATSIKQAHDQLAAKGLYPIRVVLAAEGQAPGFSFKTLFERPISLKDKLFFTKQLQVLLHSGVPLLDGLDLLSQQTEGRLKTIVIALRDGIKEGKSLADGLSLYPRAFETIYVQLVRAGEASGQLDFVLERLSTYYERQDELRKKLKSAMTYPIIQLTIVSIVTTVLFVLTWCHKLPIFL